MKKLIALAALLPLAAAAQSPALPSFSLKATDGKTYTQTSLTSRPTLVVFFTKSCPHNPKAMKMVKRLKADLGSQVGFAAMLKGPQEGALEYMNSLGANFAAIVEPDAKAMRAMGATHSLDLALISPKTKRVVKRWNGISRAHVQEAFQLLAQEGGPRLRPDFSAYPEALMSGCGL